MEDVRVRPLSGSIGAEIVGLNISKALEPKAVDFIRRQLLEFHLLFFRGQSLSTDEQIAFGRCFGELEDHYPSFTARRDDRPEITFFDGSKANGRARIWHTDATVSSAPPMGGILLMKEAPARGGDTMWADLTAAYESLSPMLQAILECMTAVHNAQAARHAAETDSGAPMTLDYSNVSHAEHPVVRVHPETGRKCLFINPFFTSHIKELKPGESRALLEHLFSVIQQPQFICRWRWQTGDLAFWDNRCTMHAAVDDYGTAPRLAERICIRGDVPVGVAAA
jgi:taurine dioxygenase